MVTHLERELSPSKEQQAMLPFWNRLRALSCVHGLRSMPRSALTRFVGTRPLLRLTRKRASQPAELERLGMLELGKP
jgi:hypothetical protein